MIAGALLIFLSGALGWVAFFAHLWRYADARPRPGLVERGAIAAAAATLVAGLGLMLWGAR